MPIVSKCPKCEQAVTIPDGVGAQAEVRCPLCAVVYPLGEALSELPPALIPLDSGAGLAADSERALKSDLISEPFHVPEADAAADSQTAAGDEAPAIDAWKKVDHAPQIETGEADPARAAVDADTTAGFEIKGAEEGEEAADQAGKSAPARPRRRRRRQKSLARELLGAVIGGAVGLLIGYYVLMWVGGDKLDVPRFEWLPFLPAAAEDATDSDDSDDSDDDDVGVSEGSDNAGSGSAFQPEGNSPGNGNPIAKDPFLDPVSVVG